MQQLLSKYGLFSDEESSAFEEIAQGRTYEAKSLIFASGSVFDKLYFVKAGMILSFRLINGQDYTYFFFFHDDFAVDYQSFLTDTVSPLIFEALTEVEVYIFQKADIYALYKRYPRFEKIGRLMAEQAYLSAAERLKQHQTDDLKTRYLKLVSKSPDLFQKIPQHYIASYLGVKPQSLSRIRAEISGKKY